MLEAQRGNDYLKGTGYQKFVGQEFSFECGHGINEPVLMDATVPQYDGFRFVYLLPLTGQRLLVEDTYFSDSPSLCHETVRARIQHYIERLTLPASEVIREESGVLPMPWRAARPLISDGSHRVGYRGGWFHPGTAYSLGWACRVAETIVRTQPSDLHGALERLRNHFDRQARFARFLNAMLFQCFASDSRHHVFERFYRLGERTIERFYSLDMSMVDRVRIVSGRPPRGFRLWGIDRERDLR